MLRSAVTHRHVPRRRIFEPCHEIFQFFQGIRIQRIVNPTALRTICHETGFFQDPQVKRQSGLAGLKRIGQLADALLSSSQPFQYAKSCLIRKRMEETDRSFATSRSRRCHPLFIYQNALINQALPDIPS